MQGRKIIPKIGIYLSLSMRLGSEVNAQMIKAMQELALLDSSNYLHTFDVEQARKTALCIAKKLGQIEADINAMTPNKADHKIISEILSEISLSINNYLADLMKPVKTQPTWQEHGLRIQQELLDHKPVNTEFNKALNKIAVLGKSKDEFGIFKFYMEGIYILDCPSEHKYLQWVTPFIKKMCTHLRHAGFCDPLISSQFLASSRHTEIRSKTTLIIGTEGLLETFNLSDHRSQVVHNQLGIIRNYQTRTIPLLLSGSNTSSFPEANRNCETWNGEISYFNNLKKLIAKLYRTPEQAFENIWSEFLAAISAEYRRNVTGGYSEQEIVNILALEKDFLKTEQNRRIAIYDQQAACSSALSSVFETYYSPKKTKIPSSDLEALIGSLVINSGNIATKEVNPEIEASISVAESTALLYTILKEAKFPQADAAVNKLTKMGSANQNISGVIARNSTNTSSSSTTTSDSKKSDTYKDLNISVPSSVPPINHLHPSSEGENNRERDIYDGEYKETDNETVLNPSNSISSAQLQDNLQISSSSLGMFTKAQREELVAKYADNSDNWFPSTETFDPGHMY